MYFYVVSHPNQIGTIERKVYPCIELLEDNWNDYGYETYYTAYYYTGYLKNSIELGAVKILHRSELITRSILPKEFTSLNLDFCSLGQTLEYYRKLKKLGSNISSKIFRSLKDIAIHKEFYNNFPKQGIEDSFFRGSEAKKAFSSAIQFFGGEKKNEVFIFKYDFTPPYSNQRIKMGFDFSEKDFLPNRICILVGKNGCGKTQFMANFANSLCGSESKENSVEAFDEMPLFSKVIGVSFSAFDNFKKPHQEKRISATSQGEKLNNYIYCGIQGSDGKTLSITEMKQTGKERLSGILDDEQRFEAWKKILKNVFEEEFEKNLLEEPEDIFSKKLSSGQSILLYTMTNVIANIDQESILLFDEPELHLHPNAISNLMRMLYDLFVEYNSYAIIATHSPLIVQEIPSRNIKKFVRENNYLDIMEVPLETFGENLSAITEDIFNVRDTESSYKTILRNAIVQEGLTLEDVLEKFPIGLSYNAMTYLNIIDKNNKRI